jgi:hypothetical protein
VIGAANGMVVEVAGALYNPADCAEVEVYTALVISYEIVGS